MSRIGNWNLSQDSLTSPEALAALRNLCTTHPVLHAALTQATETDPTSEATDHGDGDNPYLIFSSWNSVPNSGMRILGHIKMRGTITALSLLTGHLAQVPESSSLLGSLFTPTSTGENSPSPGKYIGITPTFARGGCVLPPDLQKKNGFTAKFKGHRLTLRRNCEQMEGGNSV
ncbi:hypothetical protein K438DRAFT_1781321 [Mycena galopus ATCC 62051]|nr:hypothetical protein K438DRAFT_1781321 [Mycena galopus ATCC 62051]